MLVGKTENDYVFNEEDFSTFKEKYWGSISVDNIMDRRHTVQKKLHNINIHLLPELHKKGIDVDLHPHLLKNPRLEFSWDRPVPYNHGKVNWMGTRYGRKSEVDALGYSQDSFGYKDRRDLDKIGFQKFTVFQIGVYSNGISCGIFHAVPNDSIDRQRMRSLITDKVWADGLVALLRNLDGHGLVWSISPKDNGQPDDIERRFEFDYNDPEDFITFYKDYDTDGSYSSLMVWIPKWDGRLLKDNFENTCIEIFELLYPVYKYIKWNGKEG